MSAQWREKSECVGGLRGTSAEPNAVTSPEQRAKRAAASPPQSSHGSCQLLSKAPSGGGGRADAASWGRGKVCDRGHALRKVLVGRDACRRGCVLRSALQEESLPSRRAVPRSETGRGAPLGTGGNRGTVNTSVPPGQLRRGQRANFLWLSTWDYASAGPRGRGRERGASRTQVP